jgi:hypothetical protein
MKEKSYYILVASRAYSIDDEWIGSEEMARRRLEARQWGLYENTPHKSEISPGDTLLIYIAGARRMQFIASAEAGDVDFAAKSYEADGDALTNPPAAVLHLRSTNTFSQPLPISEIKDDLDFVPKNNPKWGAVLQRGAKKISATDAKVILRGLNKTENSRLS